MVREQSFTHEGRVAVVTGATGAFGSAICSRLSELDYNVAMLARTEADLVRIADMVPSAAPFVCDVSDFGRVEEVASEVQERYGRVDVLVNSAGRGLNKPYVEATIEEIEALYRVNVLGTHAVMKFFEPSLRHTAAERGKRTDIINISSASATSPLPKGAVYAATKAAVLHAGRSLTPGLWEELIALHTVLPGFAISKGFPQDTLPAFARRFLSTDPDKVADAVTSRIGKKPGEVHVPHRYYGSAVIAAAFPTKAARTAKKLFRNYYPAT